MLQVRLSMEELATTFGGWCASCALPSLATQTVCYSIDGHPQGVFTIAHCEQCGVVSWAE